MSPSKCSNGCLTYQPKTGLISTDIAARLASCQAMSASEASSLRKEINVALMDLKGFDAQISRLRRSILALQHARAAFEECITDSKSLLSPIRRLPAEMLTEIFSYCCAQNKVVSDQGNVTIDTPATTLMRVCRSWNLTVISAKTLWASIRLEIASEMDDRDSERVRIAISRILQASGETPLDVTINTISINEGLHSSAHSLISEARRWKAASLSLRHSGLIQLWQPLKDNLPKLERLKLNCFCPPEAEQLEDYEVFAHAPHLRKITLRDLERGSSVSLPYSKIKVIQLRNLYLRDTLDILHQASSVEHLTLYDPPEESDEIMADKTVHAIPATYFRMNWKACPSESVKGHIARLSFPALEEFHLDDQNIQESAQNKFQVGIELLSHLSASSKTLHTLTLERVTMKSDDLVNLFIILPQLMTLRLLNITADQDTGLTPELIQRLHGFGIGRAERILLPKLVNLEIDLDSGGTFASLLAMVMSRFEREVEEGKCSFVSLQKVNLRIRNEYFDEALRPDVVDLVMGGTVVTICDSEGVVKIS